MQGIIPIYHATDDKRILAYLQKNIRTHSLKTGSTKVKWSDLAQKDIPAGELNFRMNVKRGRPWWKRLFG